MVNQPKKYKKFLATAATATLVASVILPAASAAATFPDVTNNNSHAQNINALVEAGIIRGYEDGTFKPNAELTRGHVVKMLGKWVESQGFEIPTDWNTVQRFDDVTVNAVDQELVKYAALVKDTGVFIGSKGDLNAAANITRENMALTLDRAYKAVFGKSLVELAAGSENVTVADLSTAKEEAREEIQALRNLGISNVSNFQPKETVTRAQFASFLNRTINASAKPIVATKIKTFTATKINEFTVVFDGPVASTDVVDFAVTKGSTAITVKDVDWNEDKTQAVLTVDETFGDATYRVTVSGVAGQDLTSSVTTTREQVTSIEFLSDYLLLTGREERKPDGKEYKQAVITFAIYNQYGEDITSEVNASYLKDRDVKRIDIYGNENDIKIDNGKFIVWVDEDEDDGATGSVELTYERNNHEISVKHNVTLSDEAEPSQVEIVGIYSPTNDELTVGNLEDGKEFSILFNVKDQYGVEIDAKLARDTYNSKTTRDSSLLDEVRKGIRVDVSDDDIFDVEDEDGTGPAKGNDPNDGIEVINVGGKYYFAIDIFADDPKDVKGGANTVTFRSKATREETSKVFTVADDDQPYSIELELPNEIIAGDENVLLPVFAYNENGDLLTDVKELNEDLREGRIEIKWDRGLTKFTGDASKVFTFIKKDGKVYLKFKSGSNTKNKAEDYDIEIEVDQSGIENELTIFVEPNAHPEKIVGIKGKGLTYALVGDKTEIELEDLLIEDQYGRTFDKLPEGTGHKNYEINVTSSNTNIFTVEKDEEKFIAHSKRKGNTTLEFKLVGQDIRGKRIEDTLDVTFRSIEAEDFDSFKVKSDGLLYGINSGSEIIDTADIEVFGVIGNLEVEIFNEDGNAYTVTTESKYLNTDGKEVTADTAKIRADGILKNKADRYKADILVTINEVGKTIRHTLTLAREDAIVKEFKLLDAKAIAKTPLEDVEIEYSDVSADHKLTVSEIFVELLEEGKFDIKDQYDNENISFNEATGEVKFFDGTSDSIRLTVSDINSTNDKGVVSSNGTSNANIKLGNSGLTQGDTFNLTLTIDGQSETVKVYIK